LATYLATVGIVPGSMTQPEFTRFVGEQIDTVGGMVKSMGIKND
jgi:tripartite-type tricarboxylate transporter receptor subunit TctC